MKKILLLFITVFLLGIPSLLKAQCYGTVNYDQSATANGLNTFTINTTHASELIMIAYNGWPGPGTGPVTVDGNPATHINTAQISNSATAEAYCYSAPLAGTHTIVCTENGYAQFNPPNYILNFAASFYLTGSCIPLSCNNLVTTETAVGGGNSITTNISTTIPNAMIFSSFVYNTGIFNPYAMTATGATVTETLHEGDGIDAAEGYTTAASPGVYSVVTNDVNSCCGGGTVLVAIVPSVCSGNGMQVVPTVNNPICGNSNGSISLAVSGGSSPYTYTWSPNVSTSDNATGLSAGTYSVTVQDATCHDTTLVFTLVSTSMSVTPNIIANEPCNGNCVGSATTTLVGGTGPYNFLWTPSGGTKDTATGLCAGTYTIAVKDVNGCTGTASMTITQPAVLAASLAGTNVLCNGGTGSITSNITGGTAPYVYLWAPGGSTNANGTGLPAGTYTMAVVDANGCTASASATITQPPTGITIALTGPPLICVGETGTLTAAVSGGTSPYAYSWSSGLTSTTSTASFTPLVSQTYTVYITDANGCSDTGQIIINLGPLLFASITGATSMCGGLSTTLCADAIGGTGGNTFLWEPGNITTPCITATPASTTTYTLSISDNCGTNATTTAIVYINPSPVVNFSANVYQGCTPLCIQFYNTTTLAQGGLASYVWSYGNGDTSHAQSPVYCYSDTAKYSVSLTVVSDSGCSSTLTKSNIITAYQHPSAAFTYSPKPATILAPTIQFTDQSTDAYNILYWSWNFGDESDTTSKLQNPTHTYHDTGTYCANLIIMDAHGCTDTVTNCLVIEPDFNLYIPSAFSPNGDAKNPTFEPKGQYIQSFEMYIFDQWGMQLYHTTDIAKGWNGTVDGGSLVSQEGVYIYKIMVTDSEGKDHTYIGNVTLIK